VTLISMGCSIASKLSLIQIFTYSHPCFIQEPYYVLVNGVYMILYLNAQRRSNHLYRTQHAKSVTGGLEFKTLRIRLPPS
jgi:hypothetical protein